MQEGRPSSTRNLHCCSTSSRCSTTKMRIAHLSTFELDALGSRVSLFRSSLFTAASYFAHLLARLLSILAAHLAISSAPHQAHHSADARTFPSLSPRLTRCGTVPPPHKNGAPTPTINSSPLSLWDAPTLSPCTTPRQRDRTSSNNRLLTLTTTSYSGGTRATAILMIMLRPLIWRSTWTSPATLSSPPSPLLRRFMAHLHSLPPLDHLHLLISSLISLVDSPPLSRVPRRSIIRRGSRSCSAENSRRSNWSMGI